MVRQSYVAYATVFAEPRHVFSGSMAESRRPSFVRLSVVLSIGYQEIRSLDVPFEREGDTFRVFVIREEDEDFSRWTFFEPITDRLFRMRRFEHLDDQAFLDGIFSLSYGYETVFPFQAFEFVEFHLFLPALRMEDNDGPSGMIDLSKDEVRLHFDRVYRVVRGLHERFEYFLRSYSLVYRPEQFHLDGFDIGGRTQEESLRVIVMVVREEGDDLLDSSFFQHVHAHRMIPGSGVDDERGSFGKTLGAYSKARGISSVYRSIRATNGK